MGNGQKGNAQVLGMLIDAALHVNGHSTGALIQKCKFGSEIAQMMENGGESSA